MSVNQRNPTAYGFSQPLIDVTGKSIISMRSPNGRDKAQITTLWINTTDQSVYIITSIVDNVANWELLSTGTGTVTDLRADDANIVAPLGGIINIAGGSNINTTGATAHTLTVNLNNSVSISSNMSVGGSYSLPNTDGTGAVGVIIFGGQRFISNRGTDNTFIGEESGDPTLDINSAIENTGVGSFALNSLTTGASNTAIGNDALANVADGSFNTAIGDSALLDVTSGLSNIGIGYAAGIAIDTGSNNLLIGINAGNIYATESNNVCIQNTGTAADANILRIGTQGSSVRQVNQAYIAGITGASLTANSALVLCGPDGKVGTLTGTSAQILIGQTGATPQWGTLTSTGGSVTITHPTAGTINLEAAGVAALTGLDGDTGSASPTAGIITIAGDGVTTQTSATSSTVTVGLTNGSNGQLLIAGGANPIWANITSTGGSVTITNGANSINLEAAGVAALTQLSGDMGTATPIAGNIDIVGSSIITTIAVGDTLAVRSTTANNGQIPIGRTDTGVPVWANITAGSGIVVNNGTNSITIAATGAESTRPAFSYTQTSDVTIPGSIYPFGTLFYLGLLTPLTQDFDQGGNVFPGNGSTTAAYFQAPQDGIYELNFELCVNPGGTGVFSGLGVVQSIITNLKSFSQVTSGFNFPVAGFSGGGSGYGALSFSVVAKMNSGHQAFFPLTIFSDNVVGTIDSFKVLQAKTLISGYLISPI